MSKRTRSKSLHGSGSGALTPLPPSNPAFEMLERQQMLGNLENRLNAQQERIKDNERFIKLLKTETATLRAAVKDLRAAYVQNLTLRPQAKEPNDR